MQCTLNTVACTLTLCNELNFSNAFYNVLFPISMDLSTLLWKARGEVKWLLDLVLTPLYHTYTTLTLTQDKCQLLGKKKTFFYTTTSRRWYFCNLLIKSNQLGLWWCLGKSSSANEITTIVFGFGVSWVYHHTQSTDSKNRYNKKIIPRNFWKISIKNFFFVNLN